MVYVWLAGIIAFAVIEMFTSQLVSVWFAGGALAAFVAACAGGSVTLQWILFIAASVILLVLTKPFVKKITKREPEKTNIDSQIGRVTVVQEDIDNLAQTGEIRLGGVSWSARSSDGSAILKGERVIVEGVEGVKLLVKLYK